MGVLDFPLLQFPVVLSLCILVHSAIQLLQEAVLVWAFDVAILDLVPPDWRIQTLLPLWLHEFSD